DVLGHSMGGKAAMQLALTQGELIDRVVVADIAPVAYGHSQSHLVRAMRGLDLRDLSARSVADRRLAATVEDAGVRAFLLQSLDLKANPPAWRLNLDVLEREMDRITGWPGTEGRFDGPALFLTSSGPCAGSTSGAFPRDRWPTAALPRPWRTPACGPSSSSRSTSRPTRPPGGSTSTCWSARWTGSPAGPAPRGASTAPPSF